METSFDLPYNGVYQNYTTNLVPMYLFTHLSIKLFHLSPFFKSSPKYNSVKWQFPTSSISLLKKFLIKPGVFDLGCVDILYKGILASSNCKLPASCSQVSPKEEIKSTWYGEDVYACVGFSKSFHIKTIPVSAVESVIDLNAFESQFTESVGLRIKLFDQFIWRQYVLQINDKHYIRHFPFNFLINYDFDKPTKALELSDDWTKVRIRQYDYTTYYRIMISRSALFSNNYRFPFLLDVYYYSHRFFEYVCTSDRSIANKSNHFYSKICETFVRYNATHMICSWVFDDLYPIHEICPVYFLPIEMDGRLFIHIPLTVRIVEFSLFDNLFHIIETSLLYLMNIVVESVIKLLEDIILQFARLVMILFHVLLDLIDMLIRSILELLTDHAVKEFALLFSSLIKILYKTVIVIILTLDEQIHFFELAVLFVAISYFMGFVRSIIILVFAILFLGVDRKYNSILAYEFSSLLDDNSLPNSTAIMVV